MKASFEDIKNRIKEEPLWYDSNGVPRYDKFKPEMCPDIYATEVILLRIACQNCKKNFLVELNWNQFNYYQSYAARFEDWFRHEKKGIQPIHYGDPPRHNGCVGETMNCYDLEVIEFWYKENFDWKRNPKYEIKIDTIEE